MRMTAGALLFLLSAAAAAANAASLPACDSEAKKYSPCELRFEWNASELAGGKSPFRDELLNVEFRGPDNTTYLMRAFWDGGRVLRVRFTPNQSGTWAYRVTSDMKRLEIREKTFAVADTPSHGFIRVANVRHWWTDDRQPHLWSSAEVPWNELDDASFRNYVDARKQDGFTHLRGIVLDAKGANGPLSSDGQPNFSYFNKLDDRLLYANAQGFVLDLILASESYLASGALDQWEQRNALLRYVISRYAPLNATWQGLERFEDRPGNRALLKDIAAALQKYDSYRHPKSTDARVTSSMLLRDNWENFIVEADANPQLGAVERQFTAAPQIHVIQVSEPDAFRHELWTSTTNGEYPTITYKAAQIAANIQAMKVWVNVMSGVRHWEFEPFFDVDGARAVGLDNVEYLLYAEKPGTVEISFSEKHKYNPRWINPRTGETIDLKDVKQDTYSETTPSAGGDWILQVPRNGRKEGMLKSYKFESVRAPEQEVELNPTKVPFSIVEPSGEQIDATKPIPYQTKIKRANRSTRVMQYMWIGEIVADGEGPRVLALGASGSLRFPPNLIKTRPALLNLRVNAINANGKAYSSEKAFQITQ
jgi:hypothetical protein